MKTKKEKKGPKFMPSPLNTNMLNYKYYYMSAKEKLLAFLLIFLAGGAAGYIFYGGLFKNNNGATTATYISNVIVICISGGIAAKVFLPAVERHLKHRRDRQLKKQFMNMLDSINSSLAAGNTLNSSLINAKEDLLYQYSEREYIVLEVDEIIAGMNNGKTIEQMLSAFGSRSNNEDIENFSNVISNCYRLGGDFKTVVRKTRNVISEKIAVEEEIQTKIASNKLQLNAMSTMPIALVGLLKLTNSSFAENLASFLGVIVTTIAIGILIAAYFWGQKIINIKQ